MMSKCPLCSSSLQIAEVTTVREYHPGYHVASEPLPTHEVPTTAALCTGCEFVLDLEYQGRAPRGAESLTAEIRAVIREMAVCS